MAAGQEPAMRKVKLTPLQNRILWILEEAGEETLGTVRATLRAEGLDDEQALRTAIDGLQRLGFVSEESAAVTLTKRGYEALTR
jgi:hypothetical protein